jgi:hypothetical protein
MAPILHPGAGLGGCPRLRGLFSRLGVPGGQPDRQVRALVNAVDERTRESFTVTVPDRYKAGVELAEQVGIDLEDG